MNNYLIHSNKEKFLTHKEISIFSTKYFCLMVDFFYSNIYLKANANGNPINHIKILDLTFKKLYLKTNSSIILNDKEELHANTPTDLGGNSNFYIFVCKTFFYSFIF